jgi:hypothetical protein
MAKLLGILFFIVLVLAASLLSGVESMDSVKQWREAFSKSIPAVELKQLDTPELKKLLEVRASECVRYCV